MKTQNKLHFCSGAAKPELQFDFSGVSIPDESVDPAGSDNKHAELGLSDVAASRFLHQSH